MNKIIILSVLLVGTVYTSQQNLYTPLKQLSEEYEKNRTFPGSQISVFNETHNLYTQFSGRLTYEGEKFDTEVDENTIYDMASVTKVMSTTSAVMILFDQKKIHLNDKLIKYLPQANNNGKNEITIKNLLLHNAGLQPDYEPFDDINLLNKQEFINWLMNCELMYPVGTKEVYSDLSMVFLQLVVEKITGQTLSEFVQTNVFSKLGMKRTFYQPSVAYQSQGACAPTILDMEWRVMLCRCIVHDPTAYVMEGISGNAGIFSYYEDVQTFMQMMLNQGYHNGRKIFSKRTVAIFTTRVEQLPYKNTRALGWDTCGDSVPQSCGQLFSPYSFGHTGYTGTSVWADKTKNLGVTIITNRVYPDDNQKSKTGIKWFRNDAMNEIVLAFEEGKFNNTSISVQQE